MKKKIISMLLAICLIVVLLPAGIATAAYTEKYSNYADALYELGLFKGTGTNSNGSPTYELGREANRAEALVMLIRMLGEEDEALSYEGTHPFTDVSSSHWAFQYVAYGYAKGYTNGISATEFGSNVTTVANMYLTMMLRALGYDDGAGDFSYNTSYLKAAEVGMIRSGEYTRSAFYRDDCVYVSFNALRADLKGGESTLAWTLIDKNAIDSDVASGLGVTGSFYISDVEASKGTVSVAFSADMDCNLAVVAYNENGALAKNGRTSVTDTANTASVTLSGLPSYFVLEVTLRNKHDVPICDVFVCNDYTQKYQQFFAKTPADFTGQTIVSFSNETNDDFAVLSDGAVEVQSSNTQNVLQSADTVNGVYVFTNINSEISSLKTGDILYNVYGEGVDDYVLAKVKTIAVSGTTATITAADANLQELFDYIKIDEEIAVTEDHLDTSVMSSELSILTDEESESSDLQAIDVGGSAAQKLQFPFKLTLGSGSELSGTITKKLTATVKIYYDFELLGKDQIDISLKVKDETEFAIKYSYKSGTSVEKKDYLLGIAKIPIGATGLSVDAKVYFVADLSMSIGVTLSETHEYGFTYTTTDGYKPISNTSSTSQLKVEGEISLKLGAKLELSLSFLSVIEISGSAEGGFQIKASTEICGISTDKNENHLCAQCIKGETNLYGEVKFSLKLVGTTLASAGLEGKVALFKFYVSKKTSASTYVYGTGTCPNKEYLVTATLQYENGAKISGAAVTIGGKSATTGSDGKAAVYLANGTYTVSAAATNDYKAVSQSVTVKGAAVNVTLKVAVSSNVHNVNYTLYLDDATGKLLKGEGGSAVTLNGAVVSGSKGARILTLTNFEFNTSANIGLSVPDGTTIVVNGNNSIKSGDTDSYNNYAITAKGKSTIKGSGSLTAIGGNCGIVVSYSDGDQNLNMTGCTINTNGIEIMGSISISGANVTSDGIEEYGIWCVGMSISDKSVVSVTGDNEIGGIYSGNLTISNSSLVTTCNGANTRVVAMGGSSSQIAELVRCIYTGKLIVSNSTVTASGSCDIGIYAAEGLNVSGNSTVTTKGNVYGISTFPASGWDDDEVFETLSITGTNAKIIAEGKEAAVYFPLRSLPSSIKAVGGASSNDSYNLVFSNSAPDYFYMYTYNGIVAKYAVLTAK